MYFSRTFYVRLTAKEGAMTIKELRKLAAKKGATVGTQRDMYGWSYWLLDKDGNDFWPTDNFFTNKKDLADEVHNLPDAL